jgi:hypothetical protein
MSWSFSFDAASQRSAFPFGWDRPKRSIRYLRSANIHIELASRRFDLAQA